jgi:AcrR family transcriptional regulator
MPPDTKDRILDSAELLFAQHGIAATSLRALTDHASVNLAAVNYHFQSKDALVQAVLFRRLNPINVRRMELLKELLARAADGRPTVEDILEAFYRPPVEAAMASRKEGRPIIALMGRIFTEPGELLASQVRAMMTGVATAFLDALQLALPEAPQNVLFWRLQFSVGVMTHTFGASHLIEGLARGRVQVNDAEEILRQMISFAAAGIRGSLPCGN